QNAIARLLKNMPDQEDQVFAHGDEKPRTRIIHRSSPLRCPSLVSNGGRPSLWRAQAGRCSPTLPHDQNRSVDGCEPARWSGRGACSGLTNGRKHKKYKYEKE